MLSLRTSGGLDARFLREHCRRDVLERFLSEGTLVADGDNIRIPEEKFFVSDEIIKELV